MNAEPVRDLIRRDLTPDLYNQIREEWKRHSLAEDRRDIPGLISTLTDDCVYEVVQTGYRWERHPGAVQFYTELLTAFPDIDFELTDIVIGPQGVCEEARATGTHLRDWRDFPSTSRPVMFRVVIFFPWDLEREKFRGERIYFDVAAALGGSPRPEDAQADTGPPA